MRYVGSYEAVFHPKVRFTRYSERNVISDLFNPLKVASALRRQGKTHLFFLMLSPFLEPLIYGHFSLVLGAIGLGAFFAIAASVVSDEPES